MAVVVVGLAPVAMPALLVFLPGYAAANLVALAAVAHLRGRTALGDYAGLSAVRPWMAAAIMLAFLSLVGIPPLAGFIGKFTLFAATIDDGYWWLAAAAVANTVAPLFYYLRSRADLHRAPPGAVSTLGRGTAGAASVATLAVIGAGLAAQRSLPRSGEPGCCRRPEARQHRGRCAQTFAERSLSALPTTETEDRLMAAAAKIGDSRMPKKGNSTPAAIGTPSVL